MSDPLTGIDGVHAEFRKVAQFKNNKDSCYVAFWNGIVRMTVMPDSGKGYVVEYSGVEVVPGCRCPICNTKSETPGPSTLDF